MKIDESKKNKVKSIAKKLGIGLGLVGIGCVIGYEYKRRNDDFIWSAMLSDAYNNQSTDLFWESSDNKEHVLKFVIQYAGEEN